MWPFLAFNIDNQGLKEEDSQENFLWNARGHQVLVTTLRIMQHLI